MIRNERQYQVTRAQRSRVVEELERHGGVHALEAEHGDWVARAVAGGLAAQVAELEQELAEYEALKSGAVAPVLHLDTLANLPSALIRARIASGLTQRDLAMRLKLPEQQIQRYEAGDYAGANVSRLGQVMDALGVTLTGEIGLPPAAGKPSLLRQRLIALGLDSGVVSRRFLARVSGPAGEAAAATAQAASRAARIFGSSVEELFAGSVVAAGSGAFRASPSANAPRLNAYAVYARYLASLLARASIPSPRGLESAEQIRRDLDHSLKTDPLPALLTYCWERGVPVLPLSDPAAFHGACWHLSDGPVIALKQRTASSGRWAFLLAHEMDHVRNPSQGDVLEEGEDVASWRTRPEEQQADDAAALLLLGEQAEAMAQVAVAEAGNQVSRLKAVVPAVAEAGDVSPDALADYLAHRLTASGINWWATANTLQRPGDDPWRTARDMLFQYVDLSRLDAVDRGILVDGLTP